MKSVLTSSDSLIFLLCWPNTLVCNYTIPYVNIMYLFWLYARHSSRSSALRVTSPYVSLSRFFLSPVIEQRHSLPSPAFLWFNLPTMTEADADMSQNVANPLLPPFINGHLSHFRPAYFLHSPYSLPKPHIYTFQSPDIFL